MLKVIQILSILMATFSYAQAQTCEGLAMQKATAKYMVELGPVQGSEGPQVFIERSLKAKEPFLNYIVGVYDNNEDGEDWTVYYFVMTKFENNQCTVLRVDEI